MKVAPSTVSHVVYTLLKITRFSNIVEKKMIENKFSKYPAPPKKSIHKLAEVSLSYILERQVWEIKPKHSKSEIVGIFLHGGAYVANLTKMHWNIVQKIVEMIRLIIYVPDYPLAPDSNWKDTYTFMDELYCKVQERYADKKIVFMGDSAGGGLALGFAQKLRDNGKKLPNHIVLFSPWLDLSMSNHEIKEYEKKDVFLTIKGLKYAAQKYAAGTDLKNPYLSPIYGDFSEPCPITVFTGTNDLLHPDSKKLREVCTSQDLPLNYFEYPGMFHDWVIFTFLPESKDALEKIKEILVTE
ncbi:alpha/beta hydrolase fold domain-containing protein [Fervidobacterium sp.]